MKVLKRDGCSSVSDGDKKNEKNPLNNEITKQPTPNPVTHISQTQDKGKVMDDQDREFAIQVLKDKIQSLQRVIASLRNGDLSESGKKIRKRNRTPGKLVFAIIEELNKFSNPAGPLQIFEALKRSGIECSAANVRYALQSHKGNHFDNPEYGLWQTTKQKEQRDAPKEKEEEYVPPF